MHNRRDCEIGYYSLRVFSKQAILIICYRNHERDPEQLHSINQCIEMSMTCRSGFVDIILDDTFLHFICSFQGCHSTFAYQNHRL